MQTRDRLFSFTLAASIAAASCLISPAAAETVDLELILAVDVSGSISGDELAFQRGGYIAALRHPDIATAVTMRGAVAIAYIEWAGPHDQRIVVPWTVVVDAAAAARVADALAAAPLEPGFQSAPWQTGTSISHALHFAARQFRVRGAEHVIDISGNGPNNAGDPPGPTRDALVAAGIVINGLPLLKPRGPEAGFPLTDYYKACVIGGPGAFVMPARNAAEFGTAIRRKLVLEIAGLPLKPTLVGFAQATPPMNCDARDR